MKMKTTHCTSILIAVLALVTTAMPLPAAVKVDTAQPIETMVAFRVAGTSYITAIPSNTLVLTSGKLGNKEKFAIIDITGGNLQDGDEVRIRYAPHGGTDPDTTKSSYWLENNAGIRRGHDGDVFKLKRVDTKFALVTPTGKFVAPPPKSGDALGVSAKQDGALLVEIIDLKTGASVIPPAAQPASDSTAPTSPSTPENTGTASPAPATDKPATQ